MTQTDNSPTPNMPNVVLAHGYDANSRRTSVAAEIGGTDDFLNSYAFDNLGRTTRIEQEGQSGGNTVAEKRVDLAYLSDGRYDTITRYADLAGTDLVATSTYGYDDAGRLTSLVHAKSTSTLADYSWTYDAHSRITQFVSPDGTTDYTYDDTHQLTEADFDYQTDGAYAWDLNGNPTGTGYSVGTNNRLLSDGTYDYEYDDEGNLVLQTTIGTGDYVEYDWDHRNRLVGVSFKNSSDALQKRVEYDYDLLDRRIAKRVDDNGNSSFDRDESYVYDGEDVVLTFDDGGSLTHRYLHGPGYDQPLADEVFSTGDLFWLLDDNQGTIRDMVEYDTGLDSTSVVNHIEYDAFGEITATSNSSVDVFYAYTGQEYDADSGLIYYGGRWYKPAMRRFISHDPSGFAAGDMKLSRYVFNGAPNFIDPSGHSARSVTESLLGPFDWLTESSSTWDDHLLSMAHRQIDSLAREVRASVYARANDLAQIQWNTPAYESALLGIVQGGFDADLLTRTGSFWGSVERPIGTDGAFSADVFGSTGSGVDYNARLHILEQSLTIDAVLNGHDDTFQYTAHATLLTDSLAASGVFSGGSDAPFAYDATAAYVTDTLNILATISSNDAAGPSYTGSLHLLSGGLSVIGGVTGSGGAAPTGFLGGTARIGPYSGGGSVAFADGNSSWQVSGSYGGDSLAFGVTAGMGDIPSPNGSGTLGPLFGGVAPDSVTAVFTLMWTP